MIDTRDQYHTAAAAFARANPHSVFYVPDTVFAETMVLTKARLGARRAVDFGERVLRSSHFLIVYLTADDRNSTWNIFSRYLDKDWSYVDCSILAIARRLQISQVFTFDHHFDQMPQLTRVPITP